MTAGNAFSRVTAHCRPYPSATTVYNIPPPDPRPHGHRYRRESFDHRVDEVHCPAKPGYGPRRRRLIASGSNEVPPPDMGPGDGPR